MTKNDTLQSKVVYLKLYRDWFFVCWGIEQAGRQDCALVLIRGVEGGKSAKMGSFSAELLGGFALSHGDHKRFTPVAVGIP